MTRKREVLASEDISDLPPPSHRHPMSGEPIWDQHAVRALLSALRAPVADAAPEYTYSDDGKTVTMTNRDRAPGYPASAPVAKPKRAPLDDWRVQAIADCLETEWDDMSPDLAESYARTIVGYLIEYEKESDRIEAKHAAEPVEPIVQAIRSLPASAPVAGEAQPVAWETNGGGPTKDPLLVARWRALGWDVRPHYAAPQASDYEVVGEVAFDYDGEKVGAFYGDAPPIETLLYIASAQPAQKEQSE